MNITILIIAILIVLVVVLEVDHFATVRRMNKQLERNKKRTANGGSDSDRLNSDLIELDRIINKLEGK